MSFCRRRPRNPRAANWGASLKKFIVAYWFINNKKIIKNQGKGNDNCLFSIFALKKSFFALKLVFSFFRKVFRFMCLYKNKDKFKLINLNDLKMGFYNLWKNKNKKNVWIRLIRRLWKIWFFIKTCTNNLNTSFIERNERVFIIEQIRIWSATLTPKTIVFSITRYGHRMETKENWWFSST